MKSKGKEKEKYVLTASYLQFLILKASAAEVNRNMYAEFASIRIVIDKTLKVQVGSEIALKFFHNFF